MCGGRGRAQEAAMGFLKLSDIEPLIDVRGFDRWVFVVDPGNSTSTCHLTAARFHTFHTKHMYTTNQIPLEADYHAFFCDESGMKSDFRSAKKIITSSFEAKKKHLVRFYHR